MAMLLHSLYCFHFKVKPINSEWSLTVICIYVLLISYGVFKLCMVIAATHA